MKKFNSTDERTIELNIDSMDRINEIESELLDEGNRSVVIVILLALMLVLLLGGFATYTMVGVSGIFASSSEVATLPIGR